MATTYIYMIRLIFLGLILSCSIIAFGQAKKTPIAAKNKQISPCVLTEAPKLRGFFLGQTVAEIEKIIPGFTKAYNKEKLNENSIITQTDYFGPWENRLNFKDVNGASMGGYIDEAGQLILDDVSDGPKTTLSYNEDTEDLNKLVWWFFEDKLYGFSIYYSEYSPDTARDFAKQLSEKTNLPKTGWIATDKSDIGSVLKCNGFKVNVSTAYRDMAHVTITDTNVEAKVMSREKEIKLQRIKAEKERLRLEQEKRTTLKP